MMEDTIARAGLEPDQLGALYLTGGSSRIPLVARLVRERFRRADAYGDPKAVVALGGVGMEDGQLPDKPTAEEAPDATVPALRIDERLVAFLGPETKAKEQFVARVGTALAAGGAERTQAALTPNEEVETCVLVVPASGPPASDAEPDLARAARAGASRVVSYLTEASFLPHERRDQARRELHGGDRGPRVPRGGLGRGDVAGVRGRVLETGGG